ncbi:flagellin hook IN motif-containing protein, partial [Vibrio cholerae]|uniref:flagellin hook IN motif-containing protein n=1 Tax=Vibrio cholerae TaxID=666 RepID=UPI0024B3433A
ALFLANFFAIEEGSDLHEWVGYVVMGAIILRLGWGGITHSPARLTAFTPSIPKAIQGDDLEELATYINGQTEDVKASVGEDGKLQLF